MAKTPQDEISTRTIVKEALSGLGNKREYAPHSVTHEDDVTKIIEAYFNKRILKILTGAATLLLGMAGVMLAAWISINSDIAVIKERQNGYVEILAELKEMRKELTTIKIQLARTP